MQLMSFAYCTAGCGLSVGAILRVENTVIRTGNPEDERLTKMIITFVAADLD